MRAYGLPRGYRAEVVPVDGDEVEVTLISPEGDEILTTRHAVVGFRAIVNKEGRS